MHKILHTEALSPGTFGPDYQYYNSVVVDDLQELLFCEASKHIPR